MEYRHKKQIIRNRRLYITPLISSLKEKVNAVTENCSLLLIGVIIRNQGLGKWVDLPNKPILL